VSAHSAQVHENIDVANRITEMHARPSNLEAHDRRRLSWQDTKDYDDDDDDDDDDDIFLLSHSLKTKDSEQNKS